MTSSFPLICLRIYCIHLPCQTCCWSRSQRWAGVRESLSLQNAAHLDYICSRTAPHGLGPQSVRRERKRRRLVTCCVHQLVIYSVGCKVFFFVSAPTCPKFTHSVLNFWLSHVVHCETTLPLWSTPQFEGLNAQWLIRFGTMLLLYLFTVASVTLGVSREPADDFMQWTIHKSLEGQQRKRIRTITRKKYYRRGDFFSLYLKL